jgi:hypothetical protein
MSDDRTRRSVKAVKRGDPGAQFVCPAAAGNHGGEAEAFARRDAYALGSLCAEAINGQ